VSACVIGTSWSAPGNQLVVADHRDQPRGRSRPAQRPVVEAGAAAESNPGEVHRQRRNQDHRRGGDRFDAQPRRLGLAQPEAGVDQATGAVLAPLQWQGDPRLVLAGDGQQNPPAEPGQRVEQRRRTGFGTHRHVGADGVPGAHQRGQMPAQRVGVRPALLGRGQPAGPQHRLPPFGLRHPIHEHTMTSERRTFCDLPTSRGRKPGMTLWCER
jgi:hypothetical protein